jgi:hypothetical protein
MCKSLQLVIDFVEKGNCFAAVVVDEHGLLYLDGGSVWAFEEIDGLENSLQLHVEMGKILINVKMAR